MANFRNYEALLNQVSKETLEELGVEFDEDGTVTNLPPLPVEVEIDETPNPYDWDNIQEGRFDLDGQKPNQYARPA